MARRSLPGLPLALGIAWSWLALFVVVPLAALVWRSAGMTAAQWHTLLLDDRTLAALRLSFGGALLAAAIDSVAGLGIAWVLVRYRFPGRTLFDGIVDLPFALPTAVAGIALAQVYARDGWLGRWLPFQVAFAAPGVLVAMMFVGLPFVVRTLQPVLHDLDPDVEDAAASLGATAAQTFWRVTLPSLRPALAMAFTLAFARSIGEFGSVVFIAGDLPGKTEIAPLLVVGRLEQYDYVGATAVAVVLLAASAVLLLAMYRLQQREGR